MTFSSPSFLAAATSASTPPRSAAEVAVAASLSLPPELPPSEPQAASARTVDSAATALSVVRNRTGLLQVEGRVPPTTVGPRAHGRPDCGRSRTARACPSARTSDGARESSATGEGGLARAALDERAHAVLLVLGVEQLGEQAGLQREALREGQIQPLVDGALGRGEGQRRTGGELLRHPHRGAVHLVVGDDG